MAIFSGIDLRNWRNSKGISAEELGLRVGYDASTIYRIEKEAQIPCPKDMMLICDALGDKSKWDAWMRTAWPESYGRMHPEPLPYSLEGAIMALYSEIQDLSDLQQRAMKDGADGKIDSTSLRDQFLKEINEMLQAAQRAKAILEGGQ